MTFQTIDDIKTANRVRGHHWFDADTMRRFRSRVSEQIYPCEGGAYFVSSERGRHQSRRRYSVRFADAAGRVTTVGEFQQFSTAAHAHAYARERAEVGCDDCQPEAAA